MKAITPVKVLTLPGQLDPHLLYLTKNAKNGLNAVMLDSSGTRHATLSRTVRLKGPKEIYLQGAGPQYTAGQGVYTIENYDSFTDYTVSISAGSVARNGNTLTVTSPTIAGNVYLCINNEYSKIVCRLEGVSAPSIIYPEYEQTSVQPTFNVFLSAFGITSGANVDTCAGIDVQVSKDPSFTIGVSTYHSSGVVSMVTVGPLPIDTNYYVRGRYTGAVYGNSPWSHSERFDVTADTTGFQELAAIKHINDDVSSNYAREISVSGTGKLILVCTPRGYLTKGCAYLYSMVNGSWVETYELKAADGNMGDTFGRSGIISSDGLTIAIGASAANANDGAVYIFRQVAGVWGQETKINVPVSSTTETFGTSVALSSDGNTLAVGSISASGTVARTGAVYIYTRTGSTWTLQSKIFPTDLLTSDLFGFSVDLSVDGNVLLAGAPYQDTNGTSVGAAYVFERTGDIWVQRKKIMPTTQVALSLFGARVAMSATGNTLLISALGTATAPGAVYSFERSGNDWTETQTFHASTNTNGDTFGFALTLDDTGTKAVVGCPTRDSNSGATYAFEKTGNQWTEVQAIVEPIADIDNRFGRSLASSSDGTLVVIGTAGHDLNTGTVYVYH